MVKGILSGDRVRLRPTQKKDIPHIVARIFDPEVLKCTVNSEVPDEKTKKMVAKEIKELVNKKSKERKDYIIELKSGRYWKPIGDCGLEEINEWSRNAVFYIALDPKYWGKGYGAEATKILLGYAFEKMLLHRIEFRVAEYNVQSIKLHRKFGFVEESRREEAIFMNCRFWDGIIFRLLKQEWENLAKK